MPLARIPTPLKSLVLVTFCLGLATTEQTGAQPDVLPSIEFRAHGKTIILEGYSTVPDSFDREINIDLSSLPVPHNWDSSVICRHDIAVSTLRSNLLQVLSVNKIPVRFDHASADFFHVITEGKIANSKYVFYDIAFLKLPISNLLRFKYSSNKIISSYHVDAGGKMRVPYAGRSVGSDAVSEQINVLAMRALARCV